MLTKPIIPTLAQVAAEIGQNARRNREVRDALAMRRLTDDQFDDARAREETANDIIGNAYGAP